MGQTNKTKYAILGILEQKPASGYDIKKYCSEFLSHFWNENYGHIYPVLKKMEIGGLITKSVETHPGKPDRMVYSITQKGLIELEDWLKCPAEYQPVRNEFLLKLVFSRNLPMQTVVSVLESERKKAADMLDELLAIEKSIETQNNVVRKLWLATVRYYIRDIRSRIEWCVDTIKLLTE